MKNKSYDEADLKVRLSRIKVLVWVVVALLFAVAFGCEKKNDEKVRIVQKIDESQQLEHSQVKGVPEDSAANNVDIPDEPVSGKLMGRPFNPDGFEISDTGLLELRIGDRFFPEAKASVVLCLSNNESPAGRTYEFYSGKDGNYCPSIVLSQKSESGLLEEKSLQDGYRLKLRFGESLEHVIPGQIYLRVPGENTEFAGVFHVSEPENPAQPPEDRHRPHMYGKIRFSPPSTGMLAAGYAGIGNDGKVYTNSAGITIEPGNSPGGSLVTCTTFKPRNTTMWTDENGTPCFRHVRLEPGTYVFTVRWEDNLVFHRWVKVEETSTLRWDPDIDLGASGTIVVETPDRQVTETQGYKQQEPVWLLPLDSSGGVPGGLDENKIWRLSFGLQIKPKDEVNKLTYGFLMPGSYQLRFRDQVRTIGVAPGEQVTIRFP